MANIFQTLLAQIRRKNTISSYTYSSHTSSDRYARQESVKKTKESERTPVKVEKEDFLLTQIDEFREKAKQLQDLLLSKESKVQEIKRRN